MTAPDLSEIRSDAELIVASPPCQFFSYCAMPWARAKRLAAEVRADPARMDHELALFRACFRLRTTKKQALRVPIYRDSVRMARLFVRRARVAGFRGMIAP